jgi:hypothetical protein
MKRREFVTAIPAIAALTGMARPSGALAQQTGFTFYSPLAEE